ncbi:MAG: hypothetical protein N3F62_06990 [Bacteroidia bacterium]|nr:hypothetical protein [Bacteroidia bacterium]
MQTYFVFFEGFSKLLVDMYLISAVGTILHYIVKDGLKSIAT